MAKDYLYPDISVQVLKLVEIIRLLHLENKDYFHHSPYPQEVERYFRSWFDAPLEDEDDETSPSYSDMLLDEGKWEALYRETVELYRDLKSAKPSAGDSSESMAYFRTMTGLMDKLVGHQERCLGIKQVHQFHTAVMEIMESVLSADQRNAVMEKLQNAIQND